MKSLLKPICLTAVAALIAFGLLAVPEPSTYAMAALGLVGLVGLVLVRIKRRGNQLIPPRALRIGGLLLLVAIVGRSGPAYAATMLNGIGGIANDPAMAGATIIDFESAPWGQTSSFSSEGVTITSPGVVMEISGGDNYNMRGRSLQHVIQSPAARYRFDFDEPVDGFGFNWGVSQYSWRLDAFDRDGNLLGGYSHYIFALSNDLDYFGIVADDIATVTFYSSDSHPYADRAYIDDVSYVVNTPDNAANASFSTSSDVDVLNLDLGTVQFGGAASPIGFDIANLLSPASGTTSDLHLEEIIGSGDTNRLTTDVALFDYLDPESALGFNAMLDTSVIGDFIATYQLNFTDELGTDQSLTLNLSGEVASVDDPAIPDLVYNAATGEVILDPDDAPAIIGYVLKNATNDFLSGNHNVVLGGVSTSLPSELSEATLGGITAPASIGEVFPVGMDLTTLSSFLTVNSVNTALGAPVVPFDLIVVGDSPAVPEPSTYVMGALALLGLALFGCRRRRVR